MIPITAPVYIHVYMAIYIIAARRAGTRWTKEESGLMTTEFAAFLDGTADTKLPSMYTARMFITCV